MNTTSVLTGMLPAVLLIAALLTVPLSWGLLRLYRRAVIRSMGLRGSESASASTLSAPVDTQISPDASILSFADAETDVAKMPLGTVMAGIRRVHRRQLGVYALAGTAYGLLMAIPWIITAGDGFYPGRYLWIAACHAWPIVIAFNLLALSRSERIRVATLYVLVLVAIGAWVLSRSPDASVGQLVLFWLIINGIETLLILALVAAPVRAVGPLVLALMATAVAGALLVTSVAGMSDIFLYGYVSFGQAVGLGAGSLFALLHVAGFLIFGLIGWQILRWLGHRYRKKKMSDQALTLDSVWLFFAIAQSISLVFEGWAWIFSGFVAFAGYKLVTVIGFARMRRAMPPSHVAPMLLILRVFALGRRSQRLYAAISRHWLLRGHVGMIAGPDLATSTVEPHEFFEFIGGKLARQFVRDEADLERRMQGLDRQPDPDGRYRVNEFFCFADTWQTTMRRLTRESSAVLMDLRSFSQANQGCLYEIEQLFVSTPLERLLFVIDGSTQRQFLEGQMQLLWQRLAGRSTLAASRRARVQLLDFSRSSDRAPMLIAWLAAASNSAG